MTCDYCDKYGKLHIDAGLIMMVLDDLSNQKRAIVVDFIKQVQDDTYHTTHALDVVNRICRLCGEDKEREDDGDRYYWICENGCEAKR